MSMDAIADALLATCENNIKSLSQILTTLQSIDALHRLKEKTDVVKAFSVIASFAPFFAPPPAPAPTPSTTVDESSVGARLERLERRAETLRRDRLEVAEFLQDEATSVVAHTPVLAHPSALEDGRDDDTPPPSQSVLSRPAPPAHLIHPVRKSELTPFAPEEKPLYSFLVYFPVYRAVGAALSYSGDRSNLCFLPAMRKWGFRDAMANHVYPRLRLMKGGDACIVVDDDLKRLEEIKKDFKEMERELWDKSVAGTLEEESHRNFFFVGTWSEEHVALVFSSSSDTNDGWDVC